MELGLNQPLPSKSMDGVLSSSEEVFRALKGIPALGSPFVPNPFDMNHITAPVPALGDAFGLNAAPQKTKQNADVSMNAPANKSSQEDLSPCSEDTEAQAKSKLERRREQNREAQRRFRQRARQEPEKEAKVAASAACVQPVDLSFLGKRIRDGPSSFPVALPKVDAKVPEPAPNNMVGLFLKQLAQSAPAPMAAPALPGSDIQMQINLLQMQQMANNISTPICAAAPVCATASAVQDDGEMAGETEHERDLKKMKRRVQNREAQRRHRMRLKQGEPECDDKSKDDKDAKGQNAMSQQSNFLNASLESIHVPSPAQLGVAPQANNAQTQQFLQMLSMSMTMPGLGGSAPMAGLSM